ncbi:hypothetical protein BOTBODRAFT_180290 [Botryobasidium botryosum FD-172 SS1]|uniref:DyP dimeric alpha+beta barrel domain-containing protein n=1 Tax=Botryobasidium botryosum (strain FD-172 SS1) TaxID=930990 RepID=A0A067LX37_BOTB1|nr:hypothetical protein BOTBODRAFT_180290 [Botryobasidium botryosum FD-172 SS1]
MPDRHIGNCALVPLPVEEVQVSDLSNLDDIQGDPVSMCPKSVENFVFFRIDKVDIFKGHLKSFKPTTYVDVLQILYGEIAKAKEEALATGTEVKRVKIKQVQIAFSRAGLNILGETEETKDSRFNERTMLDAKLLSMTGAHGTPSSIIRRACFTVSSPSPLVGTAEVKKEFEGSITVVDIIRGTTRRGKYKGREHFGYQDGISQPALRGLIEPQKGQVEVNPGVILMGHRGDSVFDNAEVTGIRRPKWTKNGTIMVFRKLEQDVVGFEDYLAENGSKWRSFIPPGYKGPDLTDKDGAELFGARLVGRWKSGTPLANAPYRDDEKLDKENWNNFNHKVKGYATPTNVHCPFTAHTRKTAPRNLDLYIAREFTESSMIVRAGIPYGRDVKDAERKRYREEKAAGIEFPHQEPRGLCFVCYQSCLDNGFVRQSIVFGGNNYFPVTSLVPVKHGQDPIIGAPPLKDTVHATAKGSDLAEGQVTMRVADDGKEFDVTGFAKVRDVSAQDVKEPFFVTSRGGECFFVPSVSTLRRLATKEQ